MQTQSKSIAIKSKYTLYACLVFVAIFGFSQKAYAAANTPSLSISSNSIAVDVDASEFGTLQSSSANVSVTTTNPAGYELKLTTTGANTNLVSGSYTIPTLASNTSVSNFPTGRWGYSLDNTTFKPIPSSTGSGDIIATTSVANSVANNYSLYIGVKLANTQPSGVYTNTLTLSATANPIIYSLYYDAAGGNNAPDSQSATSNADSFTFTVDSTIPTMTGYTFKGWCMGTITGNGEVAAPTCSGNTYYSGDPLTLQYTAPTATIYAMWQRNTATIKLGTTNNVDSVYYGTNASAINTELTTTGFTAVSNTDYYFRTEADTGYTFSSWSGWISGNNATYSDGKSFTENGGVYTINAATVPNTYTVTFKSYNGNTTYGTQTFTYDDVATALRAHDATTGWTTTPTAPTGKHFYGWASSANSTTIAYTDQQQVRNLTSTNNGNVVVYAIWASTPTTYQISFNLNGNTSFTYNNTTYNTTTSLGLCSTSVVYNGTAIPTSCSATITLPTITAPSGFTVAGWSTSNTGTSSPTYTSGQANVTLTSGTAIYAQSYKASKTLTATTQKNVSSATGTATSSTCVIAKVYNGATQDTSCNVTLPSNPYTLTAWTFNGWVNAGSSTTTATTSGTAAGGSMSISGNVNIVATWKKDVTLTVSVTFDKNGGSADRSSSGTKTVTLYNGSTTLSSTNVSVTSPTCTTRSYYTCLGYNTSSTATSSSWNVSTAKNISVSGTVAIGEATFTDTPVYYHVWQGDTHTITFKSYDGNTTYGTQDFVYGTATNIRAYNASSGWTTAPSAPSGKSFYGWASSANSTTRTYTNSQSINNLTSNTTVYAIWQKAAVTYTATTQKNVSSATGTGTTAQCTIAAVYNGSTQSTSCNVVLPSNPYTLTAWTFNGWVNAGSSTTTATTSGTAAGGSMSISGNVNIVATWKKDVTLTASVTFYKNGGSADRSASGTNTVTLYNGSTTVSATNVSVTSPTCTSRGGYVCLGYNTSSTATSSSWNVSTAKNMSVSGTVAIGNNTLSQSFTYYHIWRSQGISDITYMQDMTSTICSSLTTGTNYTLTDRRDSKTYSVAKLKDNKCWMTTNLKIINTSINSTYSNLSSGSYTIPASGRWSQSGSGVMATEVYTNGAVSANSTVYYSWNTATAGTGYASGTYKTPTGSICPKNWILPTKAQFVTAAGKYTSSSDSYANQLSKVTGSNGPKYTKSGWYNPYGQAYNGVNSYVDYWTSNTETNSTNWFHAWYFGVTSTDGVTWNDRTSRIEKNKGMSVRCMFNG